MDKLNTLIRKTQICHRFVQTIGLLSWLSDFVLTIWYFRPFDVAFKYYDHPKRALKSTPYLTIFVTRFRSRYMYLLKKDENSSLENRIDFPPIVSSNLLMTFRLDTTQRQDSILCTLYILDTF